MREPRMLWWSLICLGCSACWTTFLAGIEAAYREALHALQFREKGLEGQGEENTSGLPFGNKSSNPLGDCNAEWHRPDDCWGLHFVKVD